MAQRLITVIGGSGFLGRQLVQDLARRGDRIRVAVRRPNDALFLQPLGTVGQIQPIAANVRHPGSIARAVAGADGVVNLVGVLYEAGAQRFDAVQAEGAGNVARAAAAAGVKSLVHVSALGADAQSASAYARSKALGEARVRAAFPDAVILRPSVVFGPGDGFYNRFAAMARFSPFLPLIGGGHTRFQPVYVADVSGAIQVGLDDPAHSGGIYALGGPKTYAMREVLGYILEQIMAKRLLLPIPFPLASILGTCLSLLPHPPLTRDQVRLLKQDNVVPVGVPGLAELGIEPTPVEAVVPDYLVRYRPHGRFSRPTEV
ncbi:MAG: complex I NDUFA9 subunit family protein [Sphingomonadales bacterium]